jgi:hypothetical protein
MPSALTKVAGAIRQILAAGTAFVSTVADALQCHESVMLSGHGKHIVQ